MELAWLALGGCGLVAAAVVRVLNHRTNARVDRETAETDLLAVRHLAESDAVLFGEELARLDGRLADAELDEDTRTDYQAALDSYETALRIVDRLTSLDDISEVIDSLAAGRYAAACVLARVEGTPLPTFRVPCFFDPRHGPASTEVLWNAPGLGTRKVPACAQDAARQADGAKVDVKMVRINGQTVPYWAAGGLHQPYKNGYEAQTARDATVDIRASYLMQHDPNQFGGMGFPN
jgi:hypothetical protein